MELEWRDCLSTTHFYHNRFYSKILRYLLSLRPFDRPLIFKTRPTSCVGDHDDVLCPCYFCSFDVFIAKLLLRYFYWDTIVTTFWQDTLAAVFLWDLTLQHLRSFENRFRPNIFPLCYIEIFATRKKKKAFITVSIQLFYTNLISYIYICI